MEMGSYIQAEMSKLNKQTHEEWQNKSRFPLHISRQPFCINYLDFKIKSVVFMNRCDFMIILLYDSI